MLLVAVGSMIQLSPVTVITLGPKILMTVSKMLPG